MVRNKENNIVKGSPLTALTLKNTFSQLITLLKLTVVSKSIFIGSLSAYSTVCGEVKL